VLPRHARTFAVLVTAWAFACGEAETPPEMTQLEEAASAETLAAEIDACDELRIEALPEAANLVLVVSDTTRRDRFGAYGGPADTPRFDAFAEAGLLFEDASSNAPWTKPAMASLLTSRLPSGHGVVAHPRFGATADGRAEGLDPRALGREDVLVEELETLPEAMRRAGLRTAAIVSNPWMAGAIGFDQGFDHFDDDAASWDAPSDAVTAAALDWLAEVREGERFFLYVHYMSAHMPYGPIDMDDVAALGGDADPHPLTPEAHTYLERLWSLGDETRPMPLRARSVRLIEVAYDRGLNAFDTELGALLDALKARGDWSHTAVAVTSDHGEALFERGIGGHGRSLHEDQLSIPLAVRLPGVAMPRSVGCPTSLIDLAPTFCGFLGVPCPTSFTGSNLLAPEIDTGLRSGFLVSEAVMNVEGHRSIRNARYKLIHRPGGPLRPDGTRDAALGASRSDELYDVIVDPFERRDLLDGQPPVQMLDLRDRLRAALDASTQLAPAPRRRSRVIDPQRRERLEALGYLHD